MYEILQSIDPEAGALFVILTRDVDTEAQRG